MGRRREPLEAVAGDTNALIVQGDAADANAVRAALKQVHAKFGLVDMLIANAGGHGVGPTISMSDETWRLPPAPISTPLSSVPANACPT